jgi:PmbA protein
MDFRIDVEAAKKYLDFSADAWEIFHEIELKKTLKIEKGRITHITEDVEEIVAFRVISNERVGFSCTTDGDRLIDTCEKAIKISKISEEVLKEFPEGGVTEVKGILSKKVLDEISGEGEWLRGAANRMIEIAKDRKVNPADGLIELSFTKTEIVNSSGAELESEETATSAFIECVYEDGAAYDLSFSRDLNVDIERISKNASHFAIQYSKGGKIEPGTYNTILSPLAVHQLLFYSLYPAFYYENVKKGRSPLADKLGERIAGSVDIVDDGTADGLIASSGFDDEGNCTSRTVLVNSGVLSDFLRDWRNAVDSGKEPTGNGIRLERNSYPSTLPTNMIVLPEERENDFGNGIYIHSLTGAHTSNPVSGDFSLECSCILHTDEGEKPVRSAMIYGNVYELMKKIAYGGKESLQIENTSSPWLKFEGVDVRG